MMKHRGWFVALSIVLAFAGFTAFGLAEDAPMVRLGIVTDVHAHDTDSPNEHKVMTGYAERLRAFADAMTSWPADALIDLGDFVNGTFVMGAELGDPDRIPAILDQAVTALSPFEGPVHHVIGNHDVYDLTKEEYMAGISAEETYYSVDIGALHVVILDAQFQKSGEDYGNIGWMVQGMIPEQELEWLREDLAATSSPTLVCVHQPLDVSFALLAGGPTISNYLAVRETLSASGVVIAVFQGHTHDFSLNTIDGIHYVTFAAMVDHDEPAPPTWAAVTVDTAARTILIDGQGLQDDLELGF